MKNLTYSEIEEILKKAVECAEYYQKEYLNTKIFALYLANGDRIKYVINPASVPHLLGIDIYALKGIINLKGDNAIEMLKDLEIRAYELNTKIKTGAIKQQDVFSDFIYEKLDNFKNNIKTDVNSSLIETELVCKYKSEKSWTVTTSNKKYDYIIIKKMPDDKISLLCLVRKGELYYAMSNQVFENLEKAKESLIELISNQEITILTGMGSRNTYTEIDYNKSLLPKEKIDKSRILAKYAQEFNSYINVSKDYEYTIGLLGNKKIEKHENINTIEDIINAISRGDLIPLIDDDKSILKDLINAWNDHITKSEGSSLKTQLSYTKIIEELTKFKNLAISLEEENIRLQEENEILLQTNNSLNEKNNEKEDKINKIYEIIKPRAN